MACASKRDYGGLSHLVQAATALTALTEPLKNKPSPILGGDVVSDDGSRSKEADTKSCKKKDIFPQKLMEILSDSTLTEIVTWLPHGRSFVMIRPDVFTEKVLPKYMPPVDSRASTKYPSFTRKLNRWGFRQDTRGPDIGAFHHELFRRDKPELCLEMVCQKSREKQAMRRSCSEKKGLNSKPLLSGGQIVSDSSNASSVSSDENSSVSSGIQGSDDSLGGRPPTSIVSGNTNGNGVPLPFISSDAKFVASTLLERERMEVLKAAKAMLYDAYMKASEECNRL